MHQGRVAGWEIDEPTDSAVLVSDSNFAGSKPLLVFLDVNIVVKVRGHLRGRPKVMIGEVMVVEY